MPSRLKPVSVRACQGLQVSSLLGWTGGIAEVSLFCASEVNSPLANQCTQEEGLSPGCAIAPPGELSENMWPEYVCHTLTTRDSGSNGWGWVPGRGVLKKLPR